MRECNQGQQKWFLADVEELRARLKGWAEPGRTLGGAQGRVRTFDVRGHA
ncbi:DUF4180 domain-containing protein [Streptomyces sp. NBC_01384]